MVFLLIYVILGISSFEKFREIRTKYSSDFNKFDNYVNLMCFSKLYKKLVYANPVHKKLSPTVPNYAMHCNYRIVIKLRLK